MLRNRTIKLHLVGASFLGILSRILRSRSGSDITPGSSFWLEPEVETRKKFSLWVKLYFWQGH